MDTSLTGCNNETGTFVLFPLPAGFNFSNPDINLTHEEFGGMTSFSDSELDKTSSPADEVLWL
jgi:hypothetical protein